MATLATIAPTFIGSVRETGSRQFKVPYGAVAEPAIGDGVYYDAAVDYFKSVSNPAIWDTNLATTQAALEGKFLGICVEKDTEQGVILVEDSRPLWMECVSDTPDFNEEFSFNVYTGQSYLDAQKLVAVASGLGLFRCKRQYSAATTKIEVEIGETTLLKGAV